MPAPILSVPNLAMKSAVHGHCHEVQNTEVIYSTLNDYSSCSKALMSTKAIKKNEHKTLLSQSHKGSCILCKVLSKQFLYCSRFQSLKKTNLQMRPQASSHTIQADIAAAPLKYCTVQNKILYGPNCIMTWSCYKTKRNNTKFKENFQKRFVSLQCLFLYE